MGPKVALFNCHNAKQSSLCRSALATRLPRIYQRIFWSRFCSLMAEPCAGGMIRHAQLDSEAI